MRSNRFDKPQLLVHETKVLSLSNQALIDLLSSVLDKGVPFKFQAKGNSMEPFIKEGDVIIVSPLLKKNPSIGEVVAFIHPHTGRLIVHRIIAKQKMDYLIQGDGIFDHTDGQIPLDCILGRVTTIERNGRESQLGLGIERIPITWLLRLRLLTPLRNIFTNISKLFNR